MRTTLLAVHIMAGSLGIILGFVALYALKGATLHRRSGMLFVYAMLVMTIVGATMAAVFDKAPELNVPAALLTAYLVITGLVTVSRPEGWSHRLDVLLMCVVLAVALADFSFGVHAFTSANAKLHWVAIPSSIFGTLALLAAIGDARVIRLGRLQGTSRLARHLWRMGVALLIATSSFFLGQMQVIPKPIRIPGLLALPVLAVLATTLYWLWRVRFRRSFRGIAGVAMPKIA
ncbi:MAG: hypothetical protein ABJE10_03225 [bacterium]